MSKNLSYRFKVVCIIIKETYTMNRTWNIRTHIDRRKSKKLTLNYILFGGRRNSVRRQTDTNYIPILDTYDKKILLYSLLIILLSILDGYLTLYLVSNGASAINPLMKRIVHISPALYIFLKFFISFISMICLQILHKIKIGFLSIRVERLFPVIILIFCVVNIHNVILAIR